jgi:RND family efflux transporter MFP subunit
MMPLVFSKQPHLQKSNATLNKPFFSSTSLGNYFNIASLFPIVLITLVAFCITISSSLLAQDKKSKRPPTRVEIDPVISQEIKQTVPVIGRFVVRQAGVVSAIINGPIGEFKVQIGDKVEAGDIIAVLMNKTLNWRHELQKAKEEKQKAAVLTGRARLKLRLQELQRLEKLQKSAAFSQARLDDKRQDVIVAKSEAAETIAELASAQANRKLAEINLYNANIRAPYSGVITRRYSEVGTYVKVGDPIVDMVDNLHLEIEAEVPSNRITGLKPTLNVKAFASGNVPITATVRAVVPSENPQTRTRLVRFIPQLSAGLKNIANNQGVTLYLPSNSQTSAITVHKDAIISRKGMSLVYLAKDGKADIRPVQLGEAVGSRFIVNGGLALDDLVVIRGNERLRPGQNISYADPEKNKG